MYEEMEIWKMAQLSENHISDTEIRNQNVKTPLQFSLASWPLKLEKQDLQPTDLAMNILFLNSGHVYFSSYSPTLWKGCWNKMS